MTFTILGSLKIDKDGMTALEFIRHGVLVRFLGESDMGDTISLAEQQILSLPDREITISGQKQNPVSRFEFTSYWIMQKLSLQPFSSLVHKTKNISARKYM